MCKVDIFFLKVKKKKKPLHNISYRALYQDLGNTREVEDTVPAFREPLLVR